MSEFVSRVLKRKGEEDGEEEGEPPRAVRRIDQPIGSIIEQDGDQQSEDTEHDEMIVEATIEDLLVSAVEKALGHDDPDYTDEPAQQVGDDDLVIADQQVAQVAHGGPDVAEEPVDQVDHNAPIAAEPVDSSGSPEERKKLYCAVCQRSGDEVNGPVVLPCVHHFCTACVFTAIQLQPGCPTCRSPFDG